MSKPIDSRRGFLKRTAYVAPAIFTLKATPSFAKSGSEKSDQWDQWKRPDDPHKHPKKPYGD